MKSTKFPSVDDVVMVVPTKITDLGVYVSLPEYDGIEGLIILSEISKRRYRSINQEVKLGKSFPACVMSVDTSSDNITLSKKVVSDTDKHRCMETYRKNKTITDIMKQLVRKIELSDQINPKLSLRTVFELFVWVLENDHTDVYEIIKSATKQFDKIYELSTLIEKLNKVYSDAQIEQSVIDLYREILNAKFKDEIVNLQGVISLTCFESDGINSIKLALATGQNVNSELIIKLIAPPYYGIFLKCKDQVVGLEIITLAMEEIKTKMISLNGDCAIIKMPSIVTTDDLQTDLTDMGIDDDKDEDQLSEDSDVE
jgi:translation initiation factor 2 subunit 1